MKFLTETAIEFGLAVIDELDRRCTDIPLTAAFWAEESDTHHWTLLLGSPAMPVAPKYRNPFSAIVHSVICSLPDSGIPFSRWRVLNADSKVLQHVRAIADVSEHRRVPGRWLNLNGAYGGSPYDDIYLHRIVL